VLTFDYWPRSFTVGAVITILSILVALLLLIIPPVRKRRLRRA
jgi:competence protein ComGC